MASKTPQGTQRPEAIRLSEVRQIRDLLRDQRFRELKKDYAAGEILPNGSTMVHLILAGTIMLQRTITTSRGPRVEQIREYGPLRLPNAMNLYDLHYADSAMQLVAASDVVVLEFDTRLHSDLLAFALPWISRMVVEQEGEALHQILYHATVQSRASVTTTGAAKIAELEDKLQEELEAHLFTKTALDTTRNQHDALVKRNAELEHRQKMLEDVNAQFREKIAALDANAKTFNALLDEWQAKGEAQSRQFLDTVNAVLRAKGAAPLTERELMLTLHKIDQERKMPPPELEVDLTGLEPTVARPPTVPPPSLPKRLPIPIVLKKRAAEEFEQDDEDAASQRFDEADALPLSRPTTQLYSDTRRK